MSGCQNVSEPEYLVVIMSGCQQGGCQSVLVSKCPVPKCRTFKGGMWDASQSCRCVARETGEPVFGLETDVTAAQDMTCACATQVNIGQIAVAERGRV